MGIRAESIRKSVSGLTLVELMVSILIFGIMMTVIFSVFTTSNRLYWSVSERSELQMNTRTAIDALAQEIRSAGCDPNGSGIIGILTANADTIRVQSDLNSNGTIETAEPSEDVTYYFDPANETLVRDPGTGPQAIVQDVTNVTFTYINAANNPILTLPLPPDSIPRIRSIAITITTESRRGGEVSYATRIALRNL